MTKKQYFLTLIISGVLIIAGLIANVFLEFIDWIWFAIIAMGVYIFIRYKITGPLQMFARKFNMMVDYDLDVEGALELTKEQVENAPTKGIQEMMAIHLGMAYYYNAMYDEAIKTFNQIDLRKVNIVYHVLIFAFSAYSAYELGDMEAFDIALGRMDDVKNRVGRKYMAFAENYSQILHAIKNIEIDPEAYREMVERNFSNEDGYLSTRLIYNYRMASYYKVVNNLEEMDKCLAKVIANGKNHHTAIQAKKMFKNTVNVEDYVFPEPGTETPEEEVFDEPDLLDTNELIDQIEEVETIGEETTEDKE